VLQVDVSPWHDCPGECVLVCSKSKDGISDNLTNVEFVSWLLQEWNGFHFSAVPRSLLPLRSASRGMWGTRRRSWASLQTGCCSCRYPAADNNKRFSSVDLLSLS
jgi:hypothetical protein